MAMFERSENVDTARLLVSDSPPRLLLRLRLGGLLSGPSKREAPRVLGNQRRVSMLYLTTETRIRIHQARTQTI